MNNGTVSTHPKRTFTFTLNYYKPSGKWYTSAEAKWEIRDIGTSRGMPPLPYMPDVADKIRDLRDNGSAGALPGIGSRGWYGFILADCDDGFPCLVTPKGMTIRKEARQLAEAAR